MYDVLQVSPWCEPDVIQAAFRALARTRHPDVNRDPDAEDQMRRLNVAYQTLSDPGLRARYDEELALEAAARPVVRPAPEPAASTVWAAPAPAYTGAGGPGSRRASPGPRPTPRSAAHSASTAASSLSAAATPAYQTTIFDTRGDMLLPRSAIYVSLLIVTVIVALVAWLILDTMAQRPLSPTRVPRGYDVPLSAPRVASTWHVEQPVHQPGASVEPGLSLSDDRWNQ